LPAKQSPPYWGTAVELSQSTRKINARQANDFFVRVSRKVFPGKFDYSLVVFRSLNHPVQIVDKKTKKVFKVTPFDHLMSEDGYGNQL
jgi:hypothetical protein